jgi:hypothetical protein
MPEYRVLSGTWYTIEAPNMEIAQEAYDAFWEEKELPVRCEVFQEEVGSHWEDTE